GLAHDDGFKHLVFIKFEMILFEISEAFPGRDADRARIWRDLACQDFQKGGFARSIGANHAIAASRHEFKRHILKKPPPSKPKTDVFGTDHERSAHTTTACEMGPVPNWNLCFVED